jgi:3(or 17)beta-hydroxysteroid dehydrogenase
MTKCLQGKTALVTGAGSGIGAAIAERFAYEGARVFITDIDQASLTPLCTKLSGDGCDVTKLKLDVTDPASWQAAAAAVAQLDILVHNAGIVEVASFSELTVDIWRRVQSVNVESVLIGTQALLPALNIAGNANPAGASVILMSSVMGMVAVPDQCAYNTSKGALRQMAKAMAIEFAAKGMNIRVNSVHPGMIDTPMADKIIDEWIAQKLCPQPDIETMKRDMAAAHPLKRLGRPGDIAGGVLYLASDDAAYVTGAELVIDGGWTAQ